MKNDKSAILDEITKISDDNKLLEIYNDNDDFEIRYVIVNLINDDSILYEIFSNEENDIIKSIALKGISADALDYDDFENLDDYEKINYIETHSNESLFIEIAQKDENPHVRIAAIYRIQDMDMIWKMASTHPEYDTRFILYKKLNRKSLLEEITGENLTQSRINLVKDLDNAKILEDIAFNDFDVDVRSAAVERIDDENVLAEITKNSPDTAVRIKAVERISDESLLFNIAQKDKNLKVRIAAINEIRDMDLIWQMANTHKDYDTRFALYKKLNNRPLLEEMTGENLTQSRKKLVKKLDNEKFLNDIVSSDSDFEVKLQALKKLNKPHFYISLLKNTSDEEELMQLIGDINDESQLMDIAMICTSNEFTVKHAINNIANPLILFELYRRDSPLIRDAAMRKLVFGNVFSKEKITDKIGITTIISSLCDEDTLVDIAMNNSNWQVRRAATERIKDENVLAEIARNDTDYDVRIAAAKKIDDKDVLADIAMNNSDWQVRKAAVRRISDEDTLAEIARNDRVNYIRKAAVQKINDEDVLAEIARNDTDYDVRIAASKKIDDEDVLAEIAINDSHSDVDSETSPESDDNVLADIAMNNSGEIDLETVRRIRNQNVLASIVRNCTNPGAVIGAVKRISDEDILIDMAMNNPKDYVRENAVRNLNDKNVLTEIALNDSNLNVRMAATKKVNDDDILADILRKDPDRNVRQEALENINDANILHRLLLENFGYFSFESFTAFARNYDKMIYESIGIRIYEDILGRISDEGALTDLIHERVFGDFRALVARELVSPDTLRNLALNDLDYRVRREAVKNPNLDDQHTFATIIRSDRNDSVRLEALRRIDDEDLLEDITTDLNPVMRLHAFERLGKDIDINEDYIAFEDIDLSSIETIEDENMLYAIVNDAPSAAIRKYAFEKINDEHILADLACHNREYMNKALDKITDKLLLLNIALYCTAQSMKRKAIKKIDDEEFLLEAVQANPYNDISAYIVDRIRDESNLEIIAFNNSNPFNRKAAVNKIQSHDILKRLGEVECEEVVCTAIVRKCHDKDLLEYIGLSNPCKTVRRYVGSIIDDDEMLYKFALKECEYDNRRELISKMTDEGLIMNLLKREEVYKVFMADFEITDTDLLIDLTKNSTTYTAREYGLRNLDDMSILLDFIYSSPYSSHNPENRSIWEGFPYDNNGKELCLSIMARPDFTDMKVIEDFLIENEIYRCGELYYLKDKVCEIPSIYRIALNCKSEVVREVFKSKLKYDVEYGDRRDDNDDENEESGLLGLGALFG